jgi:hypothetical protein
MAKRKPRPLRRFRKERRLRRSPERRFNVTRAEYNHVIDLLNERSVILNEFRDAIDKLRRDHNIQLRRTAEIQADLDDIKKAWGRMRGEA